MELEEGVQRSLARVDLVEFRVDRLTEGSPRGARAGLGASRDRAIFTVRPAGRGALSEGASESARAHLRRSRSSGPRTWTSSSDTARRTAGGAGSLPRTSRG